MNNRNVVVSGAPAMMGSGTLIGFVMGTLFLFSNAYVTHPNDVATLAIPVPAHVGERAALAADLAAGYQMVFNVSETKAKDYAGWIVDAAGYHSIDPFVLSALVMTESTFRDQVRSSVGAVGPAQVRPVFWDDVCLVNLNDPSDNIWCAGMILSQYRDWCDGSMDCALQAYNVGPGHMRSDHMASARARYLGKITRYQDGLRLALN